jgi:fructose-1,6-bisphosphatase II
MDRTYVLEAVRVTEAAAVAAARMVGKGDKHAADQVAVEAMRAALQKVNINATVVIGEGERDEAPMLYIGEKVGSGQGPDMEIAVDPLEGTNLCANGLPNALSVMAVGQPGSLLHAPDTYMNKLVVGTEAADVIDIRNSPRQNALAIAKAKRLPVEELSVIILERDHNQPIIQELRQTGVRIHLISDGDVSGGIAAVMPDTGIDALFGIGAAPEGVITAAAVRCLGGEFQGMLRFRSDEERARAEAMHTDTSEEKVWRAEDLASGDVLCVGTGVTTGNFLKGVRFHPGGMVETHSVVTRSTSGTIRYIEGRHNLAVKNTKSLSVEG